MLLAIDSIAPAASRPRHQPSFVATFSAHSGTSWQYATRQLRLEYDAWSQCFCDRTTRLVHVNGGHTWALYFEERSEMVLASGSLLVGLLYGVRTPHTHTTHTNQRCAKSGNWRAWLIDQSSDTGWPASWLRNIWQCAMSSTHRLRSALVASMEILLWKGGDGKRKWPFPPLGWANVMLE